MALLCVGGAGFIGSHLVRSVLPEASHVTVYDNFTSGQWWHLEDLLDSDRLTVVEGNMHDLPALTEAVKGHDVVFHFASNPDIAKAVTQPDIDFWEGPT